MSWMITGAVVMGGASAAGIGERNKAAAKAFEKQNALYTLQQRENNTRALETTEEARRMGYLSVMDSKAGLAEVVGKEAIRRGEGATAGGSAARSITNLTINASKAINTELIKQRKEIINMWQQNEATNAQIQQAKLQARDAAKAGQTTGMAAFAEIAQGAMQGASMGKSFGSTSAGMKSANWLGAGNNSAAMGNAAGNAAMGAATPSSSYNGSYSMFDNNTQSYISVGGA